MSGGGAVRGLPGRPSIKWRPRRTCLGACPWGVCEGRVRGTVPVTNNFATVSCQFCAHPFAFAKTAYLEADAPPAPSPAAQPGLLPRHRAWRRAANDRARRHRPRLVETDAGRNPPALQLDSSRLDPARQPLPPRRGVDPARPFGRNAAAERAPRPTFQPPLCQSRPSLPGTVSGQGGR